MTNLFSSILLTGFMFLSSSVFASTKLEVPAVTTETAGPGCRAQDEALGAKQCDQLGWTECKNGNVYLNGNLRSDLIVIFYTMRDDSILGKYWHKGSNEQLNSVATVCK